MQCKIHAYISLYLIGEMLIYPFICTQNMYNLNIITSILVIYYIQYYIQYY